MGAAEYRYVLHRSWTGSGRAERVLWVMLNPSTADDRQDDPTIRRCISFSARAGASGLSVVNLYALRATDPLRLRQHAHPVGPENDRRIAELLAAARALGWPVVCAWGARAGPERAAVVLALITYTGLTALTLGLTRDGQPRHPLYLPAGTELRPLTVTAQRPALASLWGLAGRR